MPLTKYDGVVIDPVWMDLAARGDDFYLPPSLYAKVRLASYTFQLGQWRRKWREAEARNDFAALDRLDREYEMIGA